MPMGAGEFEQDVENMYSFVPTLVLKSTILLNIPDIITNAGPNASLTLGYDDFKEVKTLVDMGGGKGTVLAHIVKAYLHIHETAFAHIAKAYPHIHEINFDLPHVVQTAPSVPGIENVGGRMFDSIPSIDAIFFKGNN
ncbi:hypothetical protein SUGI_0354760 [Cryptomeria japonica]|nr:hypothetical protein SUGI_0354760 [Cryptomeria japonica]